MTARNKLFWIAAAAAAATFAGARSRAADAEFARGGTIHARHYRVVTALDTAQIGAFAKLTPAAQRKLDALQRGSQLSVDLFALADRALVVLSADLPGGPLELLICDDLDRLFVIDAERRRIASLPRDRFPDVLDLSRPSHRGGFTATLRPAEPDGAEERAPIVPPRRRVRTSGFFAKIGFEYRPPGRQANSWSVRVDLRATGADEPGLHHALHPLYHLALPHLHDAYGLQLIESLTVRAPTPLGWSTTLINETKGGPPIRHRAAVLDLGWVRLPLTRFATERPGHSTQQDLWAATGDGRQLVPRAKLAGLREPSGTAQLKVANQSPFAALIHVDGALVAWAAPGGELAVEGLAPGFYRVFAVTPTGIRSWGPVDTYIPGPLRLR